ncbi:hypothetical protein N7491_003836 [Penicillium cf. griseofulvum]|uniref:Uncharacterized protein n=1 Tax=Penicillium cf. griseofulvum TaxID=2972120 RepID=A0A9W9T1A0_9EURO|nr:hypothetical protein N7472_001984 [Penicillium cf. griseofulvum]KAJ5437284.1 hypothetical protein N7445_005828 [Penicillium cf. griseofulvum]KAJ5441430.1 hypothetical protein N7491_003836 [Penicillium cf. griseofulvum]
MAAVSTTQTLLDWRPARPDPNMTLARMQDTVQWSWACASFNFSAAGSRCSFRPSDNDTSAPPNWLLDLVKLRAPSDTLLKHPKVTAKLSSGTASAPPPSGPSMRMTPT